MSRKCEASRSAVASVAMAIAAAGFLKANDWSFVCASEIDRKSSAFFASSCAFCSSNEQILSVSCFRSSFAHSASANARFCKRQPHEHELRAVWSNSLSRPRSSVSFQAALSASLEQLLQTQLFWRCAFLAQSTSNNKQVKQTTDEQLQRLYFPSHLQLGFVRFWFFCYKHTINTNKPDKSWPRFLMLRFGGISFELKQIVELRRYIKLFK